MSAISDIANVTISLDIPGVTAAGFGIPMFLVDVSTGFGGVGEPAAPPTTRVTEYENAADVATAFGDDSVAYAKALAVYSQDLPPDSIKIGQQESGETITQALAACLIADPDWYGLAIESRTDADIILAATWTEANSRLFIGLTNDDESTLFYDDEGADYWLNVWARSALIYHGDADDHLDAGWLGARLSTDPGSATWKFASINGATPYDYGQDATLKALLLAANVNFYDRIAGVGIMREGVTSTTNLFIDLIHGRDWLQARLGEDVFGALSSTLKLNMSDNDIFTLTTLIRGRLKIGVTNGVLAEDPQPTVTAPLVSSLSAANRAARYVTPITFTARVGGAIHGLDINGVLTV